MVPVCTDDPLGGPRAPNVAQSRPEMRRHIPVEDGLPIRQSSGMDQQASGVGQPILDLLASNVAVSLLMTDRSGGPSAEGVIAMKTKPTASVAVGELLFFAISDIFKASTDKWWKVRKLIDPLKASGAQVFLQEPAQLKIIHNGKTQMCFLEHDTVLTLDNLRGAEK
ncbi:hypothetical protein NDU88_012662 [Pleurodeles waltl]|uniref:Uncharacterized protein n=1 Tax=Pleurodeles waltl TaxID=8319 RepID=A0AAV7R2A5_PLEWA|nr:hypothetical protein NDU88_012662 [Pleurodeles waltl]